MRLIDADELKIVNLSICNNCLNISEPTIYCNKCPLTDFIRTIDNAPTVEERPQGEWIELREYDNKCSICGQTMMDKWNYCPECGADMRGNNNV